MSKAAVITASVDEATLATLGQLAEGFGCTVEQLVTTAVLRFVDEERAALPDDPGELPPYVESDPLARALGEANGRASDALRAYVQPALDDLEAGRSIPHEEVMRRMRERHRSRNAA
jgi:predicted transcriptional regulator